MIKLEHTVLASPEQMEFVVEGMRNPMNSWDKSDGGRGCDGNRCADCGFKPDWCGSTQSWYVGANDVSLMRRLAEAGTDHRKFMRMMPVYVRITAPLYWWKEFDTYKVGTVANSCSTMHKITDKEFDISDFSTDYLIRASAIGTAREVLMDVSGEQDGSQNFSPYGMLMLQVRMLNKLRELYLKTKDKDFWDCLIQSLPSSYNQTRNVMLNYEVLANIYHSRKNHKLKEWRTFCKWIEGLPYSVLITGGTDDSAK